ncbi:hypothetical protein ACSS31_27860 (plasmid) [Priestia megaterium]
MRGFIKLVVTAFSSTIFFSTAYGIINLTPKSEQEPNIYYFGFTDTFVFTFIYTFPVYIVVGIIFSYLIDMMANKMQTTKVYVSKLAMYSLVGVIPALAFYFLFTGIKLDYRLLFSFLALGIFASNTFYHVLLLINGLLNKQKT